MNCKPFLSVIIPTFNSGATLNNSLRSIADQTYKDIEVIIVDGDSTDLTLEIVKRYSLKLPRLNVISEEDRGIYDAMNKGIDIATGKWIYFLGSDDVLFCSSTLEIFVKETKNSDEDILYGNVFAPGFKGIYDGEFTYSKLISKNICHQSIFFKREVFNRIGNFNLKYRALADWDHNIRWFYSSKITKRYVNFIVAIYADGGYSSFTTDPIFSRDRSVLIFFKGRKKLKFPELIELGKKARSNGNRNNIKLMLMLYFIQKIYKIKLILKWV